jgi:dihydroxy-acid dehydratase
MAFAETAGRRAVDMAREGLRPSHVLTPEAFDNAITLLMALGGSTNAVVHLLALAGRAGVALPLARFDEISRRTPMIVNVRPSGKHLVEQLFHAGGVPAVLKELRPLLHWDSPTVTGRTLGENVGSAKIADSTVISTLAKPFQPEGGIVVLSGNLAPKGAVLKRSAASQSLMHHRGRAVVFHDIDDLASRVDDDDLDITAESVMILKNAGPQGAPGMPEWGQLPIPKKLLRLGVSDLVRISDARMSGTSFGTVVLHVSPESAIGGPLGLVEDGDEIELDVDRRRLELLVDDRTLSGRAARFHPPERKYRRGYGKLFLDHVLQADEGCDFDFLRKLPDEPFQTDPIGLVGGAISF